MSVVERPQSERWFTKQEAADYARVSLRTINTWIQEGRLRVAQPSPHIVRVRPEWVDAVLEGKK